MVEVLRRGIVRMRLVFGCADMGRSDAATLRGGKKRQVPHFVRDDGGFY